MEGFEVKKMMDAVKEAAIGVTATGNFGIIRLEHFLARKGKMVVCSIGHFDNEIDVAWLNTNYGHTKVEIRAQVDKYTIDGKDIILLVEGRLVNLGCARGYPSFVTPNSFINQILAQLELWTTNTDKYDKRFIHCLCICMKKQRFCTGRISVWNWMC